MKRAILLLLIPFSFSTFAAGNLSALFSYCTFNIPGDAPYTEVYLHVIGTSVKFIPAEPGKVKSQIEVQWTVKQGDKTVHFDKYNLNSPVIATSDSIIPDFIDLQRFKLSEGSYDLELSIKDKNSEANAVTLKEKISVSFPKDSISISDIELLESFTKSETPGKLTKSGYDLVPMVNPFFAKQHTRLKFYAEIYNSNVHPGDDYIARYSISQHGKNQILSAYAFNVRHKPAPINVLMSEIPIMDLPSGNYNLNIEVRNKNNERIALKQIHFQRSNPQTEKQFTSDFMTVDIKNTFVLGVTDVDSLAGLIDCTHPIATNVEINAADQVIKQKDMTMMQRYLYFFWSKRNPQDPQAGFNAYMIEVEKANHLYSAMGMKGYATDRGRVFLQYGPPNTITDGNRDPSTVPYEIWHYYKLGNQSNRKFVFHMQDLSSNDYKLLHSDAIGELQQPKWDAILHGLPNGAMGIDQMEDNDGYGTGKNNTRSKQLFKDPH